MLGVATADANGHWSFTPETNLADGTYALTATAKNAAGSVSSVSASFPLTIETHAPAMAAALEASPADTAAITYDQGVGGSGAPNAQVTVSENGVVVGTTTADANGAWFFDPTGQTPGSHSFIASETDAAGNTATAATVATNVPDPRFDVADTTTVTSGAVYGSDYAGPVSFLNAQYTYTGSDNVVLAAKVDNVYLHSGAGEDALQAVGGSNVLDGSTGSNWLVGATGADGGHDTFFVDGGDGQHTWDTLLNFHVGDMLTMWGFDPTTGSTTWSDSQGAAGYTGPTLHTSMGGANGGDALVTFNGLNTGDAQFATSTGSSGGQTYLAISRIG